MTHRSTIGVEQEFQIVDPSTSDLRYHVSELIAATSSGMGEQIKPEPHQSIVEIGTRVCENVAQLGGELPSQDAGGEHERRAAVARVRGEQRPRGCGSASGGRITRRSR